MSERQENAEAQLKDALRKVLGHTAYESVFEAIKEYVNVQIEYAQAEEELADKVE